MKEQLVSLDVAKLAKECGFKPDREWNPEYVPGYIDYSIVTDEPEKGTPLTEFKEEDYSCDGYYLAPNQTILQKWLREKHDINIYVESLTTLDEKRVYVATVQSDLIDDIKDSYEDQFDTYEQALEDGLMEALLIL